MARHDDETTVGQAQNIGDLSNTFLPVPWCLDDIWLEGCRIAVNSSMPEGF